MTIFEGDITSVFGLVQQEVTPEVNFVVVQKDPGIIAMVLGEGGTHILGVQWTEEVQVPLVKYDSYEDVQKRVGYLLEAWSLRNDSLSTTEAEMLQTLRNGLDGKLLALVTSQASLERVNALSGDLPVYTAPLSSNVVLGLTVPLKAGKIVLSDDRTGLIIGHAIRGISSATLE